jgi:dCTP deaminase
MILSKEKIIEKIKQGKIVTSDYKEELINNQSIDVRLGKWIYFSDKYGTENGWIDLDSVESCTLQPDMFYIAHTEEFLGTIAYSDIVPSFKLKSTAGRAGIIHTLAGLGDVGFFGRWALEFIVARPVKVSRYTRIGQVYFNQTTTSGDYSQETGNYQKHNNITDVINNWTRDSILPVPLKKLL